MINHTISLSILSFISAMFAGYFKCIFASLEHLPPGENASVISFRSYEFLISNPIPTPGSSAVILIFLAVDLSWGKKVASWACVIG